jgi:hypothetical protein
MNTMYHGHHLGGYQSPFAITLKHLWLVLGFHQLAKTKLGTFSHRICPHHRQPCPHRLRFTRVRHQVVVSSTVLSPTPVGSKSRRSGVSAVAPPCRATTATTMPVAGPLAFNR